MSLYFLHIFRPLHLLKKWLLLKSLEEEGAVDGAVAEGQVGHLLQDPVKIHEWSQHQHLTAPRVS